MEHRYVIGDEKGWLIANKESGGKVELPEYLKVEFIKRAKDASNVTRDYFKVLEPGARHAGKCSPKVGCRFLAW